MQHQYTAVVGDKRKMLPTEIPQEGSPGAACAGLGNSPSTLGMSMMDPELRTRRDPGLQVHAQQNATCKRELGARFWKEELELSHYWFGVKRIYLISCKHLLAVRGKVYLHEEWKANRLFWWHHRPRWHNQTTGSQEESSCIAALSFLRTNHTAVTLTGNYYMQW